MRFASYEDSAVVPNVVVDGAPNAGTVLVVSHWPGLPTPPGCGADTSAQMVFRYLDRGADLHGGAQVVTNNHFDQDGLAGIYALVHSEEAFQHRPLLEGLAAAGDFAIADDRHAARLSMAVAALSDPARSPLGRMPKDDDDPGARLYTAALELLPGWLEDVDRCRPLWIDEDAELDAGLRMLASGRVSIEEDAELDLAVVHLPGGGRSAGHRFTGRSFRGIHPMALHQATDRTSVLIVDRATRRHHLTCRYEGWVQFRSRTVRPRVDLRPLADDLTTAETRGAQWTATPPGDLTPELHTTTDSAPSSLDATMLVGAVRDHLRHAEPAWDPYEVDAS